MEGRNNKACKDCTKKCLKIHKQSQSVSDTSSFFKVMLGDFTQFMYIPPAFAQTMTNLVDTNILLEDSFGSHWRVQVCMKRRCLAFGHGWCNFVLDHSINAGEFLVFTKISQSILSVQIFSTSGCERVIFCEEAKKRSSNKRRRTRIRSRDGKSDYTPTIQEATRREEKRARRTNAVIRRLVMEDTANEDLLVKEELLPIISPIATMPSSDNPLSLCFSQNVEKIKGTLCNGTERGKFNAHNKKYKFGEAKMVGKGQNFIHETVTDIKLSVPMEDGAGKNGSFELKSETFTVSAPTTSQPWLELPLRLPHSIGKMKRGRKVVILRDPSMRLWPLLYNETSNFVGFIGGWEEFKRANEICGGEICEFEFNGAADHEVLQVRISK